MELRKFFSKFLLIGKENSNREDLSFRDKIQNITGREIRNINFYKEAFSLKISSEKDTKNYERLEFLGDSVLGSIISWYLFDTYPKANEGYLSQMKSKIVNRKNLNKLGEDLGFIQLIQKDNKTNCLSENIYGNLLEAFIGAVYLDLGYDVCKKIILERLLPSAEIKKLEYKIISYKGLLLEWAQKNKHTLRYETRAESSGNRTVNFRSIIWIDDKKISNASESSKKKAEEKAAQRAFYILNKREKIIEKCKTFS